MTKYTKVNTALMIIGNEILSGRTEVANTSTLIDNIYARNQKSVIIKTNHKIKFNFLYDQNRILQKKIKIEHLRKETYL